MQPAKEVNESVSATPQNLLDRCLVDGDAAALSSGRSRRRKALGISFAIEIAALALLIVVPILTSIAQPKLSQPTHGVFLIGAQHAHPIGDTKHVPSNSPVIRSTNVFQFFRGHSSQRPAPATEDPGNTAGESEEWIIGQPGNDAIPIGGLSITNPVTPPSTIRKSEEDRPIKLSEGVEQAQLISRIEPRYPALALQIKKEGTVILHAIISRGGGITALDVVSGHPLLVKAALDAVRQWRYRPTLLNGEPVEVETTITVIFRLQQ